MFFLKNKYIIQFFGILIVVLFLSGVVIYQIFKINGGLQRMPSQFEKVVSIGDLERDIMLQSSSMRGYIIYGDGRFLKEFRELAAKNAEREEELTKIVREERKPLAMEIKSLNDRYTALCEAELIPLVEKGLSVQAMDASRRGEMLDIYGLLAGKTAELQEMRRMDTYQAIRSILDECRNAVLTTVLFTGAGLVFGFIFSIYYGNKVVRENTLFRLILSTTKNAVVTTDAGGYITHFNRVAENLFGIPREEVLGRHFDSVFTGNKGRGEIPLAFSLEKYMRLQAGACSIERRYTDAEGWHYVLGIDLLPFESGGKQPLGYLFLARDVTESKVVEEKLKGMAQRDSLTLLYNHSYLKQRLETELEKAKKSGSSLSFMLLDFDNFKYYNDTFGHPAGDELLKIFSRMLEAKLRQSDVTGRYGGDEFGVILTDTAGEKALEIGERLRRATLELNFPNREYLPAKALTISVGIATFPGDGTDAAGLIRMADEALYNAKRNRKNKVELYFSAFKELEKELGAEPGVLATVRTLISIINARDRYTYGHSEKVMEYSVMIAARLGLAQQELLDLKLAAFLHDTGKIDINPEVLNKKGPLTREEWELLKEHPARGARLLMECNSLKRAGVITLYHHEHYNGKGYPEGLAGEDIPLGS
ncbi:MAG: diguanylate cyclase, partial [Peptococcaceae bacterium]|nr:diguanylate cyclase [Peptococcaceae bacterium]